MGIFFFVEINRFNFNSVEIVFLKRVISLIRYTELPRKKQLLLPVRNDLQNRQQRKKTAIFQYFASSKCISCGEITVSSVCKQCEQRPQQLAIVLGSLINSWQRKLNYISKVIYYTRVA